MNSNSKLQIDLNLQPTLACEECGYQFFKEVVLIKKVSRFVIGGAEDGFAPLTTYACLKCDHINDEFNVLKEKNDKKDSPLL